MDKAMESTIETLTAYKALLERCDLDILRNEIIFLTNHPDWGMRQLATWAKIILARRILAI
jgi:hypothetical protein